MKLTEDDTKEEYMNGFLVGAIVGMIMTFLLLALDGKLNL